MSEEITLKQEKCFKEAYSNEYIKKSLEKLEISENKDSIENLLK